MQMTYLTLCQYTHRLLRAGNQQAGTVPTAIPAAAGLDQVIYDIIDAVPRAWEWVQNEHPSWLFMRKQGSFLLTAGTRTFSLAMIQAQIPDYYGFFIPMWAGSEQPYFYIYDNASSNPQYFAYPFVEYINWRGIWDRLPRPANNIPTHMTELPDKSLEFDPAPNLAPSGASWNTKFDYRVKNQVLAASGDIPILPAEYHELIAWVAVRLIIETRQNEGPLLQSAQNEIKGYMDKLKARYLPQVVVSLGNYF